MSSRWRRIGAVMRLELTIQRREPLSALYMLVFFLLGAAFAAAGPVELVRDRGMVPPDSAWSLMLASTALTAFGQVITTMVAATVVLRDRADRVSDLLAATSLTSREYLTGKLLAALVMLGVIYTAIPAGLVIGAVLGGGSLPGAAQSSIAPFLLVVLPTMLAVGGLQFAAGVSSGRLWVIVGQGLLLIWIWSAAIDGAGSNHSTLLQLVADPFGSAPLLHATYAWSDAQRATHAMPVTIALIANRVLWLVIGGTAAAAAIVAGGRQVRRAERRGQRVPHESVQPMRRADMSGPVVRAPQVTWWRGVSGTASYVCRWMLRDTGWRVLAVLGAMNVGIHAWLDARGAGSASELSGRALAAIVLHARMFLILLATIYAGELVWREREERSAALFDAVPVVDAAMVAGRVCGVIIAQLVLVALLGTSAALAAMASAGRALDVARFTSGLLQLVAAPFVLWLALALAVQVVVQQKLIGHLLVIAGWVSWVMVTGSAVASSEAGAWWVAVGVCALLVTGLGWTRGASRRQWWSARAVVSGTEKQ